MKRMLAIGSIALALTSCQVGPEERREPLAKLPDKVSAQPYYRLLERARVQATKANDAFYRDKWAELEETAKSLEETALFLAKADEVPTKHKDNIATISGDLGKLSRALRDAAIAKDVDKATDAMRKIQLKVREMRVED